MKTVIKKKKNFVESVIKKIEQQHFGKSVIKKIEYRHIYECLVLLYRFHVLKLFWVKRVNRVIKHCINQFNS